MMTALIAGLINVVPLSSPAQKADKPAAGLNIGTVNIDFGKLYSTGSQARLSAGVKMTSEQYDLTAEDVLAVFDSAQGGQSGLTKAMAEGSSAKKTQIVAHIRQPLQGEAFTIFADHAVYVPVPARPGGGRMDFTGHVKVITMSGLFAGPSPADFKDGPVTILLGKGGDYPQLQTGPGHIVVTPAQ